MSSFTEYDNADLADVKAALDADENILSYDCSPNGQIERFAATYEDGDQGQIIEQVGDDYESITIYRDPEAQFEQMEELYNSIEALVDGKYGKLFDIGNAITSRTTRLHLPDREGMQYAVEDMRAELPEETPEYLIKIEGAEPKRTTVPVDSNLAPLAGTLDPVPLVPNIQIQHYSTLTSEEVYERVPDDFKTGCQAGSCGTVYTVIDGELSPMFNDGNVFIPEELQVFAQ